ncbi:MAG: hypothetical protein UT60_C0045G0009 [candidate division CPR2 bacterium GW2011_GWD2_39_7]|nr:MAG: hypothetical protein UT60_C0045G0009 [candidate division CPR2 bacterium GW2011_GWD2_39_7]KKR29584.1 MAG: hypothetical protein UT59_C0004G0010 [candidate division CPR2 bacterium GW2011_GWD1_39_7]
MEETKSDRLTNEKLEAKYNLTGFFKLLLEIDMRVNPHLYENNGNTNYPDQSK